MTDSTESRDDSTDRTTDDQIGNLLRRRFLKGASVAGATALGTTPVAAEEETPNGPSTADGQDTETEQQGGGECYPSAGVE